MANFMLCVFCHNWKKKCGYSSHQPVTSHKGEVATVLDSVQIENISVISESSMRQCCSYVNVASGDTSVPWVWSVGSTQAVTFAVVIKNPEDLE